jgi:hypothetical protein
MAQKDDKTDLEVVVDNVGDVFSRVGDSIGSLVDDKKTAGEKASGAVGGLISASSSAILATLGLGKLVVKSIPKVIVTVAETKRDLIDAVGETINEAQKKNLDDEFEAQVKMLKNKNANQD